MVFCFSRPTVVLYANFMVFCGLLWLLWQNIGLFYLFVLISWSYIQIDLVLFLIFFLVKRPNFGCRKYISKVVTKLLPALKNDLKDWLVETRIKTSQLTYILLCHMEETSVIAQHADTLLGLFFLGVKDSEVTVMKNVR